MSASALKFSSSCSTRVAPRMVLLMCSFRAHQARARLPTLPPSRSALPREHQEQVSAGPRVSQVTLLRQVPYDTHTLVSLRTLSSLALPSSDWSASTLFLKKSAWLA